MADQKEVIKWVAIAGGLYLLYEWVQQQPGGLQGIFGGMFGGAATATSSGAPTVSGGSAVQSLFSSTPATTAASAPAAPAADPFPPATVSKMTVGAEGHTSYNVHQWNYIARAIGLAASNDLSKSGSSPDTAIDLHTYLARRIAVLGPAANVIGSGVGSLSGRRGLRGAFTNAYNDKHDSEMIGGGF